MIEWKDSLILYFLDILPKQLVPMSFFRLEEKVSDLETEDQILRQQALLNSSRRMSSAAQVDKMQNFHFS